MKRQFQLSDKEIPEPRDVMLVGLANSCGLFDEMFSAGELLRVRARIDALRKLDLIGQVISRNIREIEHDIVTEIHAG
jgi:hypothetical protein